MTAEEALITWAKRQYDKRIRERGGNNYGPEVEHFQKVAGSEPGEPWCAAFVYTGMVESGIQGFLREDYCPYLWSWAKNNGILIDGRTGNPRAGDVALFMDAEGAMGAYHVGIVISVNSDGTVSTIEGNTGPQGNSGEGDGVYKKRHLIGKCDYIRWSKILKLGESSPPQKKPSAPPLHKHKFYFHPREDGTTKGTVDLPDGTRITGPVWGKMRHGKTGPWVPITDMEFHFNYRPTQPPERKD